MKRLLIFPVMYFLTVGMLAACTPVELIGDLRQFGEHVKYVGKQTLDERQDNREARWELANEAAGELAKKARAFAASGELDKAILWYDKAITYLEQHKPSFGELATDYRNFFKDVKGEPRTKEAPKPAPVPPKPLPVP